MHPATHPPTIAHLMPVAFLVIDPPQRAFFHSPPPVFCTLAANRSSLPSSPIVCPHSRNFTTVSKKAAPLPSETKHTQQTQKAPITGEEGEGWGGIIGCRWDTLCPPPLIPGSGGFVSPPPSNRNVRSSRGRGKGGGGEEIRISVFWTTHEPQVLGVIG